MAATLQDLHVFRERCQKLNLIGPFFVKVGPNPNTEYLVPSASNPAHGTSTWYSKTTPILSHFRVSSHKIQSKVPIRRAPRSQWTQCKENALPRRQIARPVRVAARSEVLQALSPCKVRHRPYCEEGLAFHGEAAPCHHADGEDVIDEVRRSLLATCGCRPAQRHRERSVSQIQRSSKGEAATQRGQEEDARGVARYFGGGSIQIGGGDLIQISGVEGFHYY